MTDPMTVVASDHYSPLAKSEAKAMARALAEYRLTPDRGYLMAWRVYASPALYVAVREVRGEPSTRLMESTLPALAQQMAKRVGAKRARTGRRRSAVRYWTLPPTSRTVVTPLVPEAALLLAHAVAEQWCVIPAWSPQVIHTRRLHHDAVQLAIAEATAHADATGEASTVMVHLVPRTDLAVRWTIKSLREDFAVSRITVTSL